MNRSIHSKVSSNVERLGHKFQHRETIVKLGEDFRVITPSMFVRSNFIKFFSVASCRSKMSVGREDSNKVVGWGLHSEVSVIKLHGIHVLNHKVLVFRDRHILMAIKKEL